MKDTVTVKCKIYWAKLHETDDNGKYCISLCDLSDRAAQALEDMGLNVKEKEDYPDMGRYVECRSKRNFYVYDENDNRIDPDETLIANESEGIAVLSYYDWTYQKKSGRSPQLNKLKLTKLIEYTPDAPIDPAEAL